MPASRIMIVDDFEEWRSKVCSILQEQQDLQVVAEAGDGVLAVQKAAELQPDLILLDIGVPELDGIKTALKVFEVSPRSKIMFLSQNNDGSVVQAALATGASAYVHKVDAGRELLTGVETVLEGGSFVSGGRSIDRIGSESIANRPNLKTPNPVVTAVD